MKKTCVILILAVCFLISVSGCKEDVLRADSESSKGNFEVFVSPEGSDDGKGAEASPFKTIKKAQQKARELLNNGNDMVTVEIKPGKYVMEEPLQFDTRDSNSIYMGTDKDNKPIITGQRKIGNWKKAKLDGKDIWVTHIEDIKTGEWYFRQLFADGKRLHRSRYPNADEDFLTLKEIKDPDPWKVRQTFVLKEKIPFENLAQQDVETVFLHHWSISRNWLRTSKPTELETHFPVGVYGAPLCMPNVNLSRIFLEHGKGFIDKPGEWYLDRDEGNLYLLLGDGQDPGKMDITAPTLKNLMVVKSKSDEPVSNIRFENLQFEKTTWKLPLAGYHGLQAGTHTQTYTVDKSYMLSCAVYFENVRNSSFKNCVIAHTGTNALGIGKRCRDFDIIANDVYDIGANGIIVGYKPMTDKMPRKQYETDWEDPEMAPVNIKVSHNDIYECGEIHFGAVGYFEYFSTSCEFSHNALHDLPYTAVTIGLTWNDLPTTQRDSTVEYNHIYNVMQLMYDGGGIYTLGYQPGTVVRNNLIENVSNGHGLYTDEGSCRILFENNVIINAGVYGYQHHYGYNNIIRNNIFYSPDSAAVFNAVEMAKPGFFFERNIIVIDEVGTKQKMKWYSPPEGLAPVIKERPGLKRKAKFDNNLYHYKGDLKLDFAGMDFEKWKQQVDVNAVMGDPRFRNPEDRDFSLGPGSAAHKIDFKPIDLSKVGPKK